MLCTNPAANWVLTYWCIRIAEELHSVFELAKPIIGVKKYRFLSLQKNWVQELFVYTDAHVQTLSYFKNTETLHHYLSETPEQIHKWLCLIYCPGRHVDAKNLPRRTDGSRRAQQLENSRIKEGEPTLLLSRIPQPVENSGVTLAFRFWIQRDCVKSYLNSVFRNGEIVVVVVFNKVRRK